METEDSINPNTRVAAPVEGGIIETDNLSQEPAPRRGKAKYYVIAILLLLVAGGIGTFVYFHNQSEQERISYEVLENNDNPQDYRDFLARYPESSYVAEVKERLAKLEAMLQRWGAISLSDNVNDFIEFKNQFTDARYLRLCDIKIDSLDFVKAQRLGTPEAFSVYLEAHPEGRYASEASIAQGTLRDMEVNEAEFTQVTQVLDDFFAGFASEDDNRICSNITTTMSTFLSHTNVNKAEVLRTIKGMFNEHISGCTFNVNRDLKVECIIGAAGERCFKATFTVDQHIQRDNEGKTFGLYDCVAELTSQMLISSLTMKSIDKES